MFSNNLLLYSDSFSYKKALITAIPITLISLVLIKISWILVFIPMFVFIALMFSEKIFVFISIASFLVLTSTINVELRLIVQVLNILILSYLFIKTNGLNFNNYPEIPSIVRKFLLLLYISMVISTIFSNHILLGIKEIVRLSIFLLIIYSFFGLLKSHRDVRLFTYALFFSGLVYFFNVFYGFAQNDFNFFSMNLEQIIKPKGDYINLNSIGSFFVIIISLLFGYLIPIKNKKMKFYLVLLISIYISGLLITNSRAAILSTIISSLFIVYFYNKKIFYRTIFVFSISIPFLFISPLNKYIDLYLRIDRLTSGRNWIWDTVFNVIKNNPILGVGPAGTKYEMYKNIPFMLGTHAEKFILFHYNEIEFGHAHNFYLFFFSDMGILGLITSLMLPYVFIWMGFQTMKKFKGFSNEYYWLTVGITAAGIGLFIRGFFEWGNLISYGTLGKDLPFWLIFIILIYLYQKQINYHNIKLNFSKSDQS